MKFPARINVSPRALAKRAEFLPAILQLQDEAPSPLPRFVLWAVLALLCALAIWASLGRLDVVAVAEGRLVPKSQLRIVQPAEGGVMRELLVQEGERVHAGQVLARMDMRAVQADAATAENEIALRGLQLRRIDAELDRTPLAARAGDPPGLHAQVEAQREARAHAYEASIAEQRSVIARARREMQAAQETRLFAGTILENLSAAQPHAGSAEIVEACRQAEIHDFIEGLPQGYLTAVGENGVGLSGGQKQRIAIARALLRRPGILIFDEATASLDRDTAEAFARTVSRLRGSATVLFIAHQVPECLAVDAVARLGTHAAEAE